MNSQHSPTTTALSVRNLTMAYGSTLAVDNVSFDVKAGTITAVLGPNGAGKTSTIEACEGLREPSSGEIHILGLDRSQASSLPHIRRRVGVMLQDGGLPMSPQTRDVLAHVSSLYDSPRDWHELMETLELTDHARTRVRHLSGGQRQRLALACAMVGDPELMFLDEPSAGLDPVSRRTMHRMIRGLRDEGRTIILTTHLMSEADALADDVIVMARGRVAAHGHPMELLGEPTIWISEYEGDDAELERGLAKALVGSELEVNRKGDFLEIAPIDGRAIRHRDVATLAIALDELEAAPAHIDVRRPTMEDLYFDVLDAHDGPDGMESGRRRRLIGGDREVRDS